MPFHTDSGPKLPILAMRAGTPWLWRGSDSLAGSSLTMQAKQ